MKLIERHFMWMEKGVLPEYGGLCDALKDTKYDISLFEPTLRDFGNWDDIKQSPTFWGRDYSYDDNIKKYQCREAYTLRRQTIVLFICAMHGEI